MDGNNNQFGQQGYSRQPQDPYAGIPPYNYPQYQAPQNVYPQYGYPQNGFGMPQIPFFDERATRRHFSNIGMSYFAFWVISIIVGNAIALFLYFFIPEATEIYLVKILVGVLPMYVVGTPICWLLLQRVPAEVPEKHSWNFWQIIGGFTVAYSMIRIGDIIGTYIGSVIESFFPSATATTNNVQELVMTGEMWVNVLAMVIVGPVVEELLFRKFLCDRLKPYGDWVTILVTGLMFGIFHGNVTQGVYAFFLGGFLAYIYLRTGNIFLTIGYHIAVNFMGSVIPMLLINFTDTDALEAALTSGDNYELMGFVSENPVSFFGYMGFVILIYVLIVAGLAVLVATIARGHVFIKPGRLTIPSGKRFSCIILNVGMILFILGGIAEILFSTFA